MAPRALIPAQWFLITDASEGARDVFLASNVIAPPLPASSLTPLLSGLMPNRNHNDDLVRCIDRFLMGRAGDQPIFSVFAADPFIRGNGIAERLLQRGYKHIVNWPTTAQYGADFCRALDGVNLGPQQEFKNLLHLAERGLSISVAVCDAEAAAEFPRLKPEVVFLAPTFELWANHRLRSGELLRRCANLARTVSAEIPIVLMSTRGGDITLAAARKAGASALLVA